MQINVAQLLKQPIGATRSYKVDELNEYAEDGKAKFEGKVRLFRTDRGILVRGKLRAQVSLVCSRCLAEFDHDLNLDMEEEFFPTLDVSSGARLPQPEDSEAFTIDEHHVLALGEALRQYILLAIPLKPLCRPDCAGLCPHCGMNLNQGSCSCGSRKDE